MNVVLTEVRPAERPKSRILRSGQDHAAARRRDHARAFAFATGALVLATVLTRLPFMTQTLYAFDSANYALGVRDFYDVAFHQPHPPGYPLYVFFARLLNLVVHDANRALVIEGLLWSAVAVGCTTLLGRALFGRALGLLAGVLLLCTVGFWGYGEVAYPYVALAGETASLALLTHAILGGREKLLIALGAVWAISLGVRWDGAVFCLPLALWAFWSVRDWRLRGLSVVTALAIVVAFAIPMVVLSGGWDAYREALREYLQVWSPQSAYVVGDFASGGDTQANYNLNFLINYLRQMLGVGLLLVLYLIGKRFGPASLASDYRSRFLLVWIVPPLLVYVFAHLGEPGYVLSLAPAAAILIALAIGDLRDETERLVLSLRARRWRAPAARLTSLVVATGLALAIVGWNVRAFTNGVGPGRWPDLRAHDATTSAQLEFIRQQPVGSTLVLAHDIFRQLHYYVPEYRSELLFSEYVPNFETTRTRTDLAPGTTQVVVLDSPLQVAPEDAARVREVQLNGQPRVSVWLVSTDGAHAVEHGYRFLRLL